MKTGPLSWITIGLLFITIAVADPVGGQAISSPPDTDAAVSESKADLRLSEYLDSIREATIARWENEIRKLEQRDRDEATPEDGVLLLGSSSIRFWKTAAEDLAPYPVIQRGFGGSTFSDVVIFAERLISPHQFRAVVIFVANDVTGGPNDRTPDEVRELCRLLVHEVRRHNDHAPILLVEITPTEARFSAWPKIREVNAQLKELCTQEPGLHFVETAQSYLTSDGQPRPELFTDDKLHQNRQGYRLWGRLIRSELNRVLSPAQSGVQNE